MSQSDVTLNLFWGAVRQIPFVYQINGVPVDLTNAEIISEFRKPKGKDGELVARFDTLNGGIVITDAQNGAFYLNIDEVTSMAFTDGKGTFDVWVNRSPITWGYWVSRELTTNWTE